MKRTDNPLVLGCVYKNNGVFLNGRGAVYDTNYIAPTILTMSGGGINRWQLLEIQQILEMQRSDDQENMNKEKIVCEKRTDEGLRTFKGETIGTIRTIDSGGINE